MLHMKIAEGSSDKTLRAGVDLYADVSGFVLEEAEWLRSHVEKLTATGITCPAWVGPVNDLVANEGFAMEANEMSLAKKQVAADAMAQITTIVSGIPRAQLSYHAHFAREKPLRAPRAGTPPARPAALT